MILIPKEAQKSWKNKKSIEVENYLSHDFEEIRVNIEKFYFASRKQSFEEIKGNNSKRQKKAIDLALGKKIIINITPWMGKLC